MSDELLMHVLNTGVMSEQTEEAGNRELWLYTILSRVPCYWLKILKRNWSEAPTSLSTNCPFIFLSPACISLSKEKCSLGDVLSFQ